MKGKECSKIYFLTSILILITSFLFIINIWVKKKEEQKNEEKKIEEKMIIEYKANQTIRVKFHQTGEVVAMDINDYLRGVVPSEMSPSYNIEALKSQALVARTYTYQKMESHAEGEEADICDNFAHCQAYYPREKLIEIWKSKGFDDQTIHEYLYKVNEAVVSTQDQVIMYQNSLIKAFFHASSPYRTEDISQIWGGESLPYLISVENHESEEYENRTSLVELSYEEFLEKIVEEDPLKNELGLEDVKSCTVYDRTIGDRVKHIKIGNCLISAEKLRTLIGLKSTNFTIEKTENTLRFLVVGYGHGVGMSQVGADFYAKQGLKCEEIIKHYYTGVEIVTLPTKEKN